MHLLLCSLLLLAACILASRRRLEKPAPLPPGPPRLPWVGNLFNAPQDFAWKTYLDWGRIYGSDVVYMNVLGTHVVVLNTQKTAVDLLHKRSRIYSGRPCSYSISHLLQCDWILACMPFNARWRESRRILARHLSSASSSVVNLEWQRPHVIKNTRYFVNNLFQRPDSFMDHTFKLAASISVSSSYGLDVLDDRDQHISIAKKASDVLKFALVPGRYWVDMIPSEVARFIPDNWVERRARKWREDLDQFLDIPFSNANRTKMNDGMSCILSRELESGVGVRDEDILKGVLGTVFVGASSTTSAALNVFFLAMTCYPQVQKRAQRELDTLLYNQSKSLPTHDDLKDLPYCMAIIYEVLRWHVVGPIGIPHLSTEEDVYLGYRIPKESIVIPNIWAMMRDEKEFQENPDEFKPERFLSSSSSSSSSPNVQVDGFEIDRERVRKVEWVFGFGKRTCVGKSMALDILKYTICCVLTLFDIKKKKKKKLEDGGSEEEEEPRMEFESNITSSPLPFTCDIKPRSPEKKDIILKLDN